MANQSITQLPAAGAITGTELVPIVQNGATVQTTTGAIAASPAQTQTFITVNNEPTLNNSRYLTTTGSGINTTDGGPQSTLALSLTTPLQSLNTAGTGVMVKTGGGTILPRSIAAGTGLAVTDGDGVAANPTVSAAGILLSLAASSGTALLARTSGGSIQGVTLQGTAGEIDVADGAGPSNPTVGLADNAVLPGTGGVVIPLGTTGQEPVGTPGQFRFNTTTQTFDGYANGQWRTFSQIGGVTSFSAGSTGFTPSTATTGAVTLAGILNPASGGTGINNGSYSITLGGNISTGGTLTTAGNFTTSGAFALTLTATASTNVTLPTTGTLATLAGAETFTNKTISGSNNTLSNIANASLTNSSVTYNGVTVALGASGTITASTTNALTVGTGLQLDSGTTFNGSVARTISVATNGITDALLRQSSGLSVIGRSANSTGNVADIAAASDHQVLRRSGSTVDFGAVNLAQANATTGTLPVTSGGTGQTSYTNGELLIGNSTGNTLTKATLTAGSNVTITNAAGSITIASSNPGGTVTSVGLSLPAEFTVTNSPVTGSGTLTGAWANATQAYFFAGPASSTGTPTFRAIAVSDVPTLNQNTSGNAATATTATNVAGGAAGSLVYQTGAATTSTLALGIRGYVLRAGASAPEWAVIDGGTF